MSFNHLKIMLIGDSITHGFKIGSLLPELNINTKVYLVTVQLKQSVVFQQNGSQLNRILYSFVLVLMILHAEEMIVLLLRMLEKLLRRLN